MSAVKAFLQKHRYFFCVFLLLAVYELVIVRSCSPWEISTVGYAFLALDYSLGFASIILPGEVYHLLCGDITQWKGSVFTAVLYLAVILCVAALAERLLLSVKEGERRKLWILLLFFLTGPCTFTVFFTEIGVLEFYWIPLVLLFFAALKHPAAAIFSVPLCLAALLVNWNAIVCVVPFFCILLLYQLTLDTKKGAKALLGAAFVLCVVLSVMFTGYLMVCVPGNMRLSLDEFHTLMLDKGVTFFHYVDSCLYRTTDRFVTPFLESNDPYAIQQEGFLTYFPLIFKAFFSIVVSTFSERNPLRNLGPFLSVVPPLLLLEGFFVRRIKDREVCRLRRFAYFCMGAMFFVTIMITTLFSFDYIKWLSYAFLLLFSSFLFLLSREREAALGYLKTVFAKIPLPAVIVYLVAYAALVVNIYY